MKYCVLKCKDDLCLVGDSCGEVHTWSRKRVAYIQPEEMMVPDRIDERQLTCDPSRLGHYSVGNVLSVRAYFDPLCVRWYWQP